ncbi:Alpha/beta hydrolase family protein [compost metagenome]
MKVSPALLESALNTPEQAIQMINTFSRATLSPPNGAGSWVFGAGVALGRRVLASNAQVNLLHAGFNACDRYAGGEAAIAAVTCPVLFALGAQDQMTPPKAAQGLIQAAQAAGKQVQRVLLPMGHNQMTESPDETLFALRDFLQAA